MSYYGMRALLVYYMTKHLGFSQSQSSIIYGLYTAAVWLAPLPGGALADRYLGQHRSVLIGGSLMAIGHFLMSFESLLFPALGAIAIGNGLFKPNISTQVGDLYAPNDPRRDRGYSVYYFGVSCRLVYRPAGLRDGRRALRLALGIRLAGLGMFVGLATYQFGRRFLPPDRLSRIGPAGGSSEAQRRWIGAKSWRWQRSRSRRLSSGRLTSSRATRSRSGPTHTRIAMSASGAGTFLIPATWFQSLNGLFIIALTPAC